MHAHGISISPRAKTLPLNVAYPFTRSESARFDPESRVWRLLKKWQDYAKTYQKPDSSFWALPRETAKRFPATIIDTWLKSCLLAVDRKPQPGEKYSGHSLRKGGASAANAIGVQLPAIMASWRLPSSTSRPSSRRTWLPSASSAGCYRGRLPSYKGKPDACVCVRAFFIS